MGTAMSERAEHESAGAPKGCCTPHREPGSTAQENASRPARPVADETRAGMVALPGGRFLMGTDSPESFPDDGEGPVRAVSLRPFSMDRCTVTNRRFAEFVDATGYRTDAERYGWSFVFWLHVPEEDFQRVVLDRLPGAPWWCTVRGATWKSPEGPGSDIGRRQNHPVVHVSWNDAAAFANWSGQRLPSEAEWEYAARGGLEQKLYSWGDKLRPEGRHLCNIWQGEFPSHDTAEDGYSGTCPVEAFPPNGYGLCSVTGNTWEWCADWFSTDFHRTGGHDNPAGPPEGSARVLKGGSFLCHKSYCNRYRVAARTSNTPDSSSSHMSFRCAWSE